MSTVTSALDYNYAGIALDPSGALYILDGCALDKVSPNAGTVTVVAANVCTASGIASPTAKAIAVDHAANIYVLLSNVVLEVTAATGAVSTVAGNSASGSDSGDGGPAASATLSNPAGIALDAAGDLFISESLGAPVSGLGGKVRRVDGTTHIITTIAGTGTGGFSGNNGPAINAQLGSGDGLAVDAAGQILYIADPVDSVIWKVNLINGTIAVYAGTGLQHGNSGDGGPAKSATFANPLSLALDSNGNLYIGDTANQNVRLVGSGSGIVETVAGNGSQSYGGDGSLATETGVDLFFDGPSLLAVDASGNLYVDSVNLTIVPPDLHTQHYLSQIFRIPQQTTSLSFPVASPGLTASTHSLLLWNSGNAPLIFTSPMAIDGADAGDFAETNNCGSALAQGRFCTISLTFAPSATGTRTANLVISDITPGASQTVLLIGNGGLQRMMLNIDIPGARSSPFLGLATFAGWAIDNVLPVANVAVSVDGAPAGTATYGANRSDVCAVYQNQVGCPNVGWSFVLDTTRFASGTHTLEVTATSASGQHVSGSSSFSIANWTSNNPTQVAIDVPNTKTSYSGMAAFGGWAINKDVPISGVQISVDGVPYSASYGGNRGDVCGAFPNTPGCPNVGWNASFDTTAIADGSHTLAVTAIPAGGAGTTVTTSFTVANNTSTNPIKLSIDAPGAIAAALSGMAALGGWAVSGNGPIDTVSIAVDGLVRDMAAYGGERPDVCAVFPNSSGCPNVGWNFLLDTTMLTNGTHMLGVTASTSTGENATMSRTFMVANATVSKPTRIFIDVPSGQTSVLSGVTTLSGWALNDTAAITQLNVYVDGYPSDAFAANYGLSRPDVCLAYPGKPGCPNVGWSLILNTTRFPNGTHTLTVSASATNGQSNIISSTFTVANWTATGNPINISIDVPNSSSAPLTGTFAALGGWAIDKQASVTTVAIAVDGVFNGNAAYGFNRADVCAVFPNQPNCPNAGWNYALDTTLLADGTHTLDVTALASDGQNYTTSTSFKVANDTTANPIKMSIDIPNSASKSFGNNAAFGGWAIDDNAAISSVSIYVDGVLAGLAAYGSARADVCTAFPGRPGCPDAGWNFLLDTTKYANGTHILDVTALAADGQRETLSTSFNISN